MIRIVPTKCHLNTHKPLWHFDTCSESQRRVAHASLRSQVVESRDRVNEVRRYVDVNLEVNEVFRDLRHWLVPLHTPNFLDSNASPLVDSPERGIVVYLQPPLSGFLSIPRKQDQLNEISSAQSKFKFRKQLMESYLSRYSHDVFKTEV